MSESNATVNALHRKQTLLCLLVWEGRLSNGRLQALMGLTQPRASLWIREFREQHPAWTEWQAGTRSFHATSKGYREAARIETASELLSRYLSVTGAQADNNYLSVLGTVGDMVTPEPSVFATLNEAIRLRFSVRLSYRSMSNPEPHTRTLSPHSLVLAGRRWHTRAYCDETSDFRDFALGRMSDLTFLEASSFGVELDAAWNAKVKVRIEPHPTLTSAQASVVRFEFLNDTSARIVTSRGALLPYLIQELRAATEPAVQKPPEYQLAIANLKEVREWLLPGH